MLFFFFNNFSKIKIKLLVQFPAVFEEEPAIMVPVSVKSDVENLMILLFARSETIKLS